MEELLRKANGARLAYAVGKQCGPYAALLWDYLVETNARAAKTPDGWRTLKASEIRRATGLSVPSIRQGRMILKANGFLEYRKGHAEPRTGGKGNGRITVQWRLIEEATNKE